MTFHLVIALLAAALVVASFTVLWALCRIAAKPEPKPPSEWEAKRAVWTAMRHLQNKGASDSLED